MEGTLIGTIRRDWSRRLDRGHPKAANKVFEVPDRDTRDTVARFH